MGIIENLKINMKNFIELALLAATVAATKLSAQHRCRVAFEGDTCGGYDEGTGRAFPDCARGLTCVSKRMITIPGAGNHCLENQSMLRKETTAMGGTSLQKSHSLNALKDSCAFHMEDLESQELKTCVLKNPSTLRRVTIAMGGTSPQESHSLNARKGSCAFHMDKSESQVRISIVLRRTNTLK